MRAKKRADRFNKTFKKLSGATAKGIDKVSPLLRRRRVRDLWGRNPKKVLVSKLKAGDIVLFKKEKATLKGAVFGLLTGTPFYHAGVYLGENRFAHLDVKGMHEVQANIFFRNRHAFFFRSKLSSEQQNEIDRSIRSMKGTQFNKRVRKLVALWQMMKIKVTRPKVEGYMCTSIIAEAFAKAGVKLIPGVNPLRVGLAHLMNSKKLELIN